ncbi:hypothetical protein AAG570_013290, partial [Ranatra chinensis]
GDGKGPSINAFLKEVELLREAIYLFNGPALTWYKSIRFEARTWSELVLILKEEYEDEDYEERLEAEIKSRRQGLEEKFGTYVAIMKTYFSRLKGPMPEEKKLKILTSNVSPFFYQRISIFQPQTVEEFMEIGRRAQKEKEHLERFERPPPVGKDTLETDLAYRGRRKELKVSAINVACRTEEHTTARVERQPYSVHSDKDNGGQIASGKNRASEERPHSFQRQEETKGVKMTLCWNCRKIGHPYRQCPSLNFPFCTQCGNPRAVNGLCQKCCENTQQGNGRRGSKKSGQPSPPKLPAAHFATGVEELASDCKSAHDQ